MTAKRIWLWLALLGALLPAVLLSPRTPEVGASTRWANAVSPSIVSTEEGQTYPLALGAGNTRVGEVIIRHDSTHLYVEFKTDAGYSLDAAHVCASVAAFGWTSPGKCPYTESSLPAGTKQYTFAIPLAQINAGCGASVLLQAHASIISAASESLGGAYAGVFKGQVTYAVNCCGNNVCDLRAGEDATTCPSDCRWDSDNTTLPRGAKLVSPEQFQELATDDGFKVITRAALEAELAAERRRIAAARKLVDDLATTNPSLTRLKPTEPREQPWLLRLGDGNYRLTLNDGSNFIVHGTDWMYQETANSLTRTPSRSNQEAIFNSLIDLLPNDRRSGLPDLRQLSAVGDADLIRHNQELARRVEIFVPNEPINDDLENQPRLANVLPADEEEEEPPNPVSGCNTHYKWGIYEQFNWPLKLYTTRVRSQGTRGTCVAFATVAGLETRIWRTRGIRTDYSEQELYATAKGFWFPTSNAYGDGLSTGSLLDELVDNNYELDSDLSWRYNRSPERVDNEDEGTYTDSCVGYEGFCSDTNHQMDLVCTPSSAGLTCAYRRPPEVTGSGQDPVELNNFVSLWNPLEPENSLTSIRAQLNLGRPVVMGFEIDDAFRNAADAEDEEAGVVQVGEGGEGKVGGHAVLVVGYISNTQIPFTPFPNVMPGSGGGYLIIKNSWGCSGDGGFMYLSYNWVIDQAKSAFAVIGVDTSATLPSVTLSTNKSVLSFPGTVRVTAAVNAATTKVEIFQGLDSETPVLVKDLSGGNNTTRSVDLGFTNPEQNGIYMYWARVRDQFGNKVQSNIVGVNVNLDGAPPQIQLAAASTSVLAPGTVTLQANASDNVGVAKVKFFRGFQLLGEDHSAPYTLTHSVNLADLGTVIYVALAYDTTGNIKMSNPVSVNVLAALKPFVLAFSASPASLGSAGGQVTLSWNVAGANSVQISPAVGIVATQGSTTVAVAQTTTFVLTATSSAGATSTATAVVSVAPLVSPLVFEFKATPSILPAGGGATTLSWNVIGSQMQLFIDGFEVTGLTSKQVTTTETRTYTLTATNAGGTVTREVTVTVNRETSGP